VTLGHVGDFVRQYRGQLALALGVEKAGVHLDPATEEGRRVDAGIVDEEEGEREAHPVGIGQQPLAQIVDVFVEHGVIDDGQARPGKTHEGVAVAHLLLDGQCGDPGGTDVGQLVAPWAWKVAPIRVTNREAMLSGGKTCHVISISNQTPAGIGRIPLPFKAHKRCFILSSRP
jgi:hypothetical protein